MPSNPLSLTIGQGRESVNYGSNGRGLVSPALAPFGLAGTTYDSDCLHLNYEAISCRFMDCGNPTLCCGNFHTLGPDSGG